MGGAGVGAGPVFVAGGVFDEASLLLSSTGLTGSVGHKIDISYQDSSNLPESSSLLEASQSDFASPLVGIASIGSSIAATGSGDLGRDSGVGETSFATGSFFLRFP